MPKVEVLLYKDEDGTVPLVEWFGIIRPTARARILARLKRLEELGHELRRPEADLLRDGVYELRVKDERLHYRLLYFFHGTKAVVVSHGFVKNEARVPEKEIERALRRKRNIERNPLKYTFRPGA